MSSQDIKILIKKIDDMKIAMDFMNDKFETTLRELVLAKEENAKYKELTSSLNRKVTTLESQVNQLKTDQLRNNLEIAGLPCKKDENCHQIALSVIKQICPQSEQADIVEAHRIGSVTDSEGRPREFRNLVVKFKERKMRDQAYKNKKRLRGIDTVKLGLADTKQKVYVNENLSRETKIVFKKANDIKKKLSWKFIWSNYGIIYLRKNEDSKVIRVSTELDLKNIN